jgi:hypothetical protein
VHTPVHASWLNQIEIYFAIIQGKVLTPNDFESLAAVEERLKSFEQLHNAHPKPFNPLQGAIPRSWLRSRSDTSSF